MFFYKKTSLLLHPKRILIVRLWALGSSLLTFPMIKQLQDHYGKDVQYDLLATSRNIGVFKNQWYFGQIYDFFSLKGILKMLFSFKKYDIVIDAEEYFNISSLVTLWTGKLAVGYDNVWLRKLAYTVSVHYNTHQHNLMNCLWLLTPLHINIYIPETMEKLQYQSKDTLKVHEFIQQHIHKKMICIHTWWAETSPDRFWSQENWVKLIEELNKTYGDKIIILLSGTQFEEYSVKKILHALWTSHNVINICWKFNLFEFAYLLTKCHLMISNDTGPMHLAASMGTHTIGLFWPNIPQIFGPWPLDKNISLYKGTGHVYIKPHLWIFENDLSDSINKIYVHDVMESVLRFWI